MSLEIWSTENTGTSLGLNISCQIQLHEKAIWQLIRALNLIKLWCSDHSELALLAFPHCRKLTPPGPSKWHIKPLTCWGTQSHKSSSVLNRVYCCGVFKNVIFFVTNETAHYSNYITREDKLARQYVIFKDTVLSMQLIFITNLMKTGKKRIKKLFSVKASSITESSTFSSSCAAHYCKFVLLLLSFVLQHFCLSCHCINALI